MTGEPEPKVENLVDMINRLIDPPAPDQISFVPQTAGWWVLASLVFVALAYFGFRRWQRWKENAYRRAALAELEIAGNDPAAIAGILRRTSLAAFPRREVAALTGQAWLTFLRDNGQMPIAGDQLISAPYTDSVVDPEGLRNAARIWIQSHRRKA